MLQFAAETAQCYSLSLYKQGGSVLVSLLAKAVHAVPLPLPLVLQPVPAHTVTRLDTHAIVTIFLCSSPCPCPPPTHSFSYVPSPHRMSSAHWPLYIPPRAYCNSVQKRGEGGTRNTRSTCHTNAAHVKCSTCHTSTAHVKCSTCHTCISPCP